MALVGYRDLAWLKARLLPADMGEDSDFDADISDIGRGVAAIFDRFAGRTLRRTVGAVTNVTADHEAVVVGCYPIESVTAALVIDAGGSQSVLGSILSTMASAGIVRFAGEPGASTQTLSITVTGGYWCQDGEDDVMPTGATPLPDDLLTAWVIQCRAVCEAENTFRTKGAEKADKKTGAATITGLTLTPQVRAILTLFMRQP